MDLPGKFIKQVHEKLQVRSSSFLLAISGGIDSVVLCDLFFKAELPFVIAHCNFQLRGQESERDEQFVRSLGDRYRKRVLVNKFDTKAYAEENKLSIQVAARNLRYNWFRELITSENLADKIVTAHHADDNIETVVMNFFRGTGLKGLVGMDQVFASIYRPLLGYRKIELIEYARHHSLDYVEDSSNISSNYTRNYFRNDLLPAISKVFPAVEENIINNIKRLSEVEQVYTEAIKGYKKKLIKQKGNEQHIPILQLLKSKFSKTIIWEIIKEKHFTSAQVDEVVKLADADNGSFVENGGWRIIKNRNWFIISPKQDEDQTNYRVITETDKKVVFGNSVMHIEQGVPVEKVKLSSVNSVALINSDELKFPLLLRKCRQGDYFYPLGMQKKKKLNRFFIDQKLSIPEKENTWVIESDKRIVWVIGLRIDDRFKITPGTKTVVKLTTSKHD
jgi:tRNA(Ile)-lysidine synthase